MARTFTPRTGPAADIRKLSAAYPIALLPVRLETRFVTTGTPQLQIRVYPDEIAADLHEPRLTAAELAAGTAFWTEAWQPAAEPTAWQRLVARYQPTRAAWIARVTTPANVAARPAGAPAFPTVAQRDATLTGATTSVLPDAWLAVAYRGGVQVATALGTPIAQPLHLTFRPDVTEGDPSLVNLDELALEPELAWAVDFQRALAAGMACVMPLDATSAAQGFDRLIVVGVKTSLTPDAAAAALAALLDAHHYSRGLALVRQGTPTNNTTGAASGYPPPADAAASFAVERATPLAGAGSDGARLATALGVPATVFDHVDGANRSEDAAAGAMSRALWPCTLGYFLEQLATPLLTDAQIADLRTHAAAFLRGRGPYAAFRVGRVPYGVLPVTALGSWHSATGGTVEGGLAARLASWKQQWLALSAGAARVGRTRDPDADLLGVLGLDASMREIRLREVIGPAQVQNMLLLLGAPANADAAVRATLVNAVVQAAGLPASPRFASLTYAPTAPRIGRPFVTPGAVSESAPLAPNYIDELRSASLTALRAAGQKGTASFGNPLLYHLLRQALLVELSRISVVLSVSAGAATANAHLEVELVKLAPAATPGAIAKTAPAAPTAWERFAAPLPAVTASVALGDWLLQPSTDLAREPVRDYLAALAALSPLPTAELERLVTETLDTCSHRLDAWLTSLATRALATLRTAQPSGVHLGAFAWVENVRPAAATRATPGGFVHAPSATHAAAAAILRNAYLTRTGAERDQVAIDLSSQRVRTALGLLDGVRHGQPLGALLGYRFEAALHAGRLDPYIAPFRAAFPLGNDPASAIAPGSERIPARDVVDGLALRAAAGSPVAWAQLPAVAAADRDGVARCLALLVGDVDAAADLMLAESIYQVAQSNVDRASATLDALAGGAALPDPEIAAAPRRATSYSQRVAIALGDAAPLPAGWSASAPRGLAEPRLNAWLAARFGDPARVRCRVSSGARTATVALADLGLCPLDVVALARAVPPEGGGELDACIAVHAAALSLPAPIQIDHARGPDGAPTLLELLDAARALDAVIGGARPLAAQDLTADASGGTGVDAAELAARSVAARAALTAARAALAAATTPGAIRAALWVACGFGVREAVPGDDPAVQVAAALAELDRRTAAAAAAADAGPALAAVFGAGFTVLPAFAPANAGELAAALGASAALVGDPYATRRWFDQAARTRAPLGRMEVAAMVIEALGGGALDVTAAQLPHVAGRRWNALPINAANPPVAGVLSLALWCDAGVATAKSLAGLVVDDWTEAIPAATQLTSYAVQYDAPGAEAAQCVLLAVPPAPAATWDLPTLLAIVEETLDLAAIRAVDSDLLGPYALLVPTTYIAANVAGDAISLDLAAHAVAETAVLEHV